MPTNPFFDLTPPSDNCVPCGSINNSITLPQGTCFNPCPHAHQLDGGSAWSSYISAPNSAAWVGKMPQWNGSEFIPVSGGGGSGTVTSVAASISGALSVGGSPITTSGTLAFAWTGTSSQYVLGNGTLATIITNNNQLINGEGFITSAALSPYLTSATASATYYPLSNPSGYISTAITSLNGLTAATQTFANDTNVTITSATSTHTLGWSGELSGTRGGTGVNNGARTITIAGNLAFTGANNISFTTTGAYTYTLPSATSTLLQTSSELTVSFGATTSNLTIPSAGGGYPFHTQLYRAAKVGGNGLVINVIERLANTWDILGMYTEANYVLGYKSGSTYNNFLYMVGGAAPYGYIGYATSNPSSTDSMGSRIFAAINGGISISSVAGGILSNTALPAIYCSTGKGSTAGDLYLAARSTGNGTSTGAEVHLITQGTKRVTCFYNGQTEILGAVQYPYVTKSANYTLTDLDYSVEFTAAATATLPDIVTTTTLPTKNSGRTYVIVNNSASSVTISRNTAGQIWNQGTAANTFTLTTNKTAIIQAGAGTDYRILSVY